MPMSRKKIANTQCNFIPQGTKLKKMKLKFSRRKETNIRLKINETESRKKIEKVNE